MKLNVAKSIADISGFENDSKMFSIRQSSKAFKVLSSNIYSDKIRAVIREYSTNALDAHVMVNTPEKPFQVHLPNFYEPWFSVRDFGPGLNHKDVMVLYTTYFESTKEDTNDQTGCLGLGSKSGFAYSDQFTVTSVFKGTKRSYTAYISEGGAPAITMISEQPTDEPSGMEIYIPVKSTDVNAFVERAQQVYQWFKVFPEITGQDLKLRPIEYAIQGSNWGLRAAPSQLNLSAYALQGPVAYPINVKNFTNTGVKPELLELLRTGRLSIEFPMGSLNITASREDLEYDKNTQQSIITEATRVFDELVDHFSNLLSSCQTEWEAQHVAERAIDSLGGLHVDIRGGFLSRMQWKGQPFKSKGYFTINTTRAVPTLDPLTNQTVNRPTVMVQVDYYSPHTLDKYNKKRSPERFTSKSSVEVNIDSREGHESLIVYEDVKRKAPVRTILDAYAGSNHRVYVIKCDPSYLADVLDNLGNPPVVNISSLPEPVVVPKAQKQAQPKAISKVTKLNSYNMYLDRVENYDMTRGGYYLPTFDGRLVHPGKLDEKDWGPFSRTSGEILSGLSKVVPSQIPLPPGLFLLSSSERGWRSEPEWNNFYDVVKDNMNALSKDKKKLEALCFLKGVYIKLNEDRYLTQGMALLLREYTEGKLKLSSKSSKMAKLLELVTSKAEEAGIVFNLDWNHSPLDVANSVLQGYAELSEFIPETNLHKEVDKIYKKVFKEVDKVFITWNSRYPGVMVMLRRFSEFKDHLGQYINVCDKAKA